MRLSVIKMTTSLNVKSPCRHTGYHSDDISTGEDSIDFLGSSLVIDFGGILESERTLTSFPCMLSSSLIPETYAFETLDLSRSEGFNEHQCTYRLSNGAIPTVREILSSHTR